MANPASATADVELWKFLADVDNKRVGMHHVEIAQKLMLAKKITHEQQSGNIRTNTAVWVAEASDIKIKNQVHGILMKGSNGICILHCKLFHDDKLLSSKDAIADLLPTGFLHQEQRHSLEEGFLELEKLHANPVLIKDSDRIHANRIDIAREMEIPDGLFHTMKTLQVVSLLHTGISSIPTSIFLLYELRVLVLRGCSRLAELPALIGKLRKLELLDLSFTMIKNLPKEVGELICLQILRLRGLGLETVPLETTKLHSLRELDMSNCSIKWGNDFGVEYSDDSGEGSDSSVMNQNTSLKQIVDLDGLTSLQVMVEKFECVNQGVVNRLTRLQRLHLIIGPSVRNRDVCDFSLGNYDKVLVFRYCKCSSVDGFSVLTDLECLIISSCPKLSSVSILLGGQRNLRDLRIENCGEMIEVSGYEDGNPLRNLENLILDSLPLLEGELELGENLTKIQITNCPKLINLQSCLSKTQKLMEIYIGQCEGIEVLEEEQLVGVERLDIYCLPQLRRISIPRNLKFFHVWRCPELRKFPYDFSQFEHLEELSICDVCELEELLNSEINEAIAVLPKLRTFDLLRLQSLKKICEGELGTGSFGSLEKLKVSHCPKLLTLFSSSFGRLWKLKQMHISNCDEPEKLVEEKAMETDEPLKCLERIHLTDLPKLSSIFIMKSGMEFLQNLEVLYLSHCSALKVVIPSCSQGLQRLRHIYVGDCDSVQQIVGEECLSKNALPSLRRILIANLPSLRALWEGETKDGALKSLETLEVTKCPQLKSLLPSGSGKLEKLSLIRAKECEKMVSVLDRNPVEAFALRSLETLDLSNLGEVKALWRKGMEIGALGSLQKLTVSNCPKLEDLWDGELLDGALGNLQSLRVAHCPELKVLLPSSLQRLEKLQVILVTNCGVQMVAREAVEENALPNLKTMQLHDLPRLEVLWVEKEHGSLAFREMKRVSLKNCPSLSELPFGLIKCRNLECLLVQDCERMEKIVPETSENALPGLLRLHLQSLSNVKAISAKKLGAGCLDHLEHLEVTGVQGLKSFPPDLCTLSKLRNLHVRQCNDMDALIIEVKWEENMLANLESIDIQDLPKLSTLWEGDSGKTVLKSLERVHISGCQKLKTLPSGLTKHERLKQLQVKNCESIETIFQEEGDEVVLLPNLTEMKLEAMQCLIRVCEGRIELPMLEYLTVVECPKLMKLPFMLNISSLKSITGSKEWWNSVQFEGDLKVTLGKCFKAWPTEGFKVKGRLHRFPFRFA